MNSTTFKHKHKVGDSFYRTERNFTQRGYKYRTKKETIVRLSHTTTRGKKTTSYEIKGRYGYNMSIKMKETFPTREKAREEATKQNKREATINIKETKKRITFYQKHVNDSKKLLIKLTNYI